MAVERVALSSTGLRAVEVARREDGVFVVRTWVTDERSGEVASGRPVYMQKEELVGLIDQLVSYLEARP